MGCMDWRNCADCAGKVCLNGLLGLGRAICWLNGLFVVDLGVAIVCPGCLTGR